MKTPIPIKVHTNTFRAMLSTSVFTPHAILWTNKLDTAYINNADVEALTSIVF